MSTSFLKRTPRGFAPIDWKSDLEKEARLQSELTPEKRAILSVIGEHPEGLAFDEISHLSGISMHYVYSIVTKYVQDEVIWKRKEHAGTPRQRRYFYRGRSYYSAVPL